MIINYDSLAFMSTELQYLGFEFFLQLETYSKLENLSILQIAIHYAVL